MRIWVTSRMCGSTAAAGRGRGGSGGGAGAWRGGGVGGGGGDLGDQRDVRVALGGEPGEERYRLEPAQVAVEEVLPDRDVGEPVSLRRLDDPQHVAELVAGRDRPRDVAEQQSDLHHA